MKLSFFKIHSSKVFIAACICLMNLGFVNAQDLNIKGSVSGDGDVLPGVNIIVKGTNTGAVSDFYGNYSIKADANAVLVFTYLGFETQEVSVNNQSTLDVTMLTDLAKLDEVIVVGYGTQKKKK